VREWPHSTAQQAATGRTETVDDQTEYGQNRPFAVAAEISDEQRFAPARRSSGAVRWTMLGKMDSCCLILILCAPPHCDGAH
jgi:hypothetical protein